MEAFVEIADRPTGVQSMPAATLQRLLELLAFQRKTDFNTRRSWMAQVFPPVWSTFKRMIAQKEHPPYELCAALLTGLYVYPNREVDKVQCTLEVWEYMKAADFVRLIDTSVGCTVITLLMKTGHGHEYFEEMKTHGYATDLRSYETLVKACCDVNDFSKAAEYLDIVEEEGLAINSRVYNYLMKGLSKGAFWKAVLDLKRRMDAAGVRANSFTYTIILNASAELHGLDMTETIAEEMELEGESLDQFHYGTLVKAAGRDDNVERAEYWYNKMREAGFPPSGKVINSLMAVNCRVRDMDRSEELFNEMPRYNVKPTNMHYYNMIAGYINSRNDDKASFWLEKVLKDGIVVEDSNSPFTPFIQRYLHQDDDESARKILDLIKREPELLGKSDTPFVTFMSYYGKRNLQAMLDCFQEVIDAGLAPSPNSFNTIMAAYANLGKVEDAENWHKRKIKAGHAEDQIGLAVLMTAYRKAKRWDDGYTIWKRLRGSDVLLREETVTIFIKLCNQCKQLETMREEVISLATDSYEFTPENFKAMVFAYGDNNDIESALRVLLELMPRKDNEHFAEAGMYVAQLLDKAENHDEARRLRRLAMLHSNRS
ncbi:pentatricopeptide repeat domain-containing protein, variant [Spizellomyces punctatus DAOM BR117]|nr:pentatricopeptide repeat domain-containing protein, variant [Spizellomyces punctatus DAOM BR117]KND01050.1 pentatricopeptide repeat domain-containing protein, variant [Spizellomyces punctatus DAOM BR117]|eukprot:XP_016609089.1 pentatricopeptide repeat domain-containing protein, variant [Spizellomyces punctatus DAOM BR117]